jgi:hypothetical protein
MWNQVEPELLDLLTNKPMAERWRLPALAASGPMR